MPKNSKIQSSNIIMAAGCEICCYFFKNLNQFRHFSAILFLFFLLLCVEESVTTANGQTINL